MAAPVIDEPGLPDEAALPKGSAVWIDEPGLPGEAALPEGSAVWV